MPRVVSMVHERRLHNLLDTATWFILKTPQSGLGGLVPTPGPRGVLARQTHEQDSDL